MFKALGNKLCTNGRIVIEKPSEKHGVLPVVKAVKKKGCKSLCLTTDQLIRVLKKSGFSQVQLIEIGPFELTLNLEQLFSSMRARYASTLSSLSDEEIDSGIEEMREEYGDRETIEWTLKKDLVVAIK